MKKNELVKYIKNTKSVKKNLTKIYKSNVKVEDFKKIDEDKLEDFKNKNIMIIKNEMYNYLNVDLGLEIEENSIDEVYQLIWNNVIDEFL